MENKTPEDIALKILAFEFRKSEIDESNQKIRKRIGAKKMDSLGIEWLENLRSFKNSVMSEVHKNTKSKYYKSNKSGYADMSDFKVEEMITSYTEEFNSIPNEVIGSFIPYSIYLYYMR